VITVSFFDMFVMIDDEEEVPVCRLMNKNENDCCSCKRVFNSGISFYVVR